MQINSEQLRDVHMFKLQLAIKEKSDEFQTNL